MSFSLYSLGDIMLGENVHHFRRGIITKFKNRYSDLISPEVRDLLSDSDFLILNMESSLAGEEYIRTRTIENGVYVAPLESLQLLKNLHKKIIVNIANNHFSQHGYESASFSINQFKQHRISVTGKDHNPLIISKNEMVIKIWGVSLIEDKNACGAYFHSSYENLIQDINPGPKGENEIRIISIHWGDEYYTQENEKQRNLAKQLSESGFDLVLGHHPHVIQPIDNIGNTKVVYSHGNFIFDQNFSALTQIGLICRFNFPNNKPKFLLSQQKRFRLIKISETDQERIAKFCRNHFHINKPLMMRIKMKLELLKHFHDLNVPIISTFVFRYFNRK